MTYNLARAAAFDAGNRSMRREGRIVWSLGDWNAMAAELERLWPAPKESTQ